MTRKTRRIVLLIAVPLAVLLAAGAAAFLRAAPAAAAADVPEAKYLLRRCDGMVAVFLPGRDTPEYITDTPVSSLPAADRAALQTGLPVYTEEELARLLEDYCS